MKKQSYTYDMYDSCIGIITEFGTTIIKRLNPKQGEKILDVGCGTGVLTREIAECGCEVVALDVDAAMIEAAKARGVDARVVDGTELSEDEMFDAAVSNAVLHWMGDKYTIIRGVWHHLKPCGRFIADCGADGCLRIVREGLKGALTKRGIDYKARMPWNFCEYNETQQILKAQGFKVQYIARVDKPIKLHGALKDWLKVCAVDFMDGLSEEEKDAVYSEVEAYCKPMLFKNGSWYLDYVRLRFEAIKPEETNPQPKKKTKNRPPFDDRLNSQI